MGLNFNVFPKTNTTTPLKSFKEVLIEDAEKEVDKLRLRKLKELRSLQEIKYFIINGNLNRAKRELKRFETLNKKLLEIKERYQIIIDFIDEDFKKLRKRFLNSKYQLSPHLKSFCLLKLFLNLGKISKTDIKKDLLSCELAVIDDSSNNMNWIREFINYFNFDLNASYLTNNSFFLNFTKNEENALLWLKYVLYFDLHQEAVKLLYLLDQKIFDNPRLRELIALVLYRSGQKEKAEQFVTDIDLANAYNIRGNLALERKEFEVAYGLFQLAIDKKNDSINAIQRSIPLSWLIKDPNKGEELLFLSRKNSTATDGQFLFLAATKSRQKKHQEVIRILDYLSFKYNNYTPEVMGELYSYNYLMMNEQLEALKYASETCKNFDLINCYLQSSLNIWDNFGKTLKRNEKVFDNDLQEDLFTAYLNNQIPKIEEDVFLDQKDILELDEREQETFFRKIF